MTEKEAQIASLLPTSLVSMESHLYRDETLVVNELIDIIEAKEYDHIAVKAKAAELVQILRNDENANPLEKMLHQMDLSSPEGLAMLQLCEALPRIPDNATAYAFLEDKLQHMDDFEQPSGDSVALKASQFLAGAVGQIYRKHESLSQVASPVVKTVFNKLMKRLGQHFVLHEDFYQSATNKVQENYSKKGFLFSYDMLGEAARSQEQADHFFEQYSKAIKHTKLQNTEQYPTAPMHIKHGVSVKLSALSANYELQYEQEVISQLYPKLKELVLEAMEADVSLTIDAEETRRLDISLLVITMLLEDTELKDYQGLGFAVQAYHKAAIQLIEYIASQVRIGERKVSIRLVKGAYWDDEIKQAQIGGFEHYPVFTRKVHTDLSYVACMYALFDHQDVIYPQFATHNALSIASVTCVADRRNFEFQSLYGMGGAIANHLNEGYSCRIYAPVGPQNDLLPYLLRRLMENTANSSFLKQASQSEADMDKLLASPIDRANNAKCTMDARIVLPVDIYGKLRKNSKGSYLSSRKQLDCHYQSLNHFNDKQWQACSIIRGHYNKDGEVIHAVSPSDLNDVLGQVTLSTKGQAKAAIESLDSYAPTWSLTDTQVRADILIKAADLLENNRDEFIALIIKEAGKTLELAIDEIREAIDFLRYYAYQARRLCHGPTPLPSVTGETNSLRLKGRGVFVCISPWNFPLAIFIGQVAAALAAGNVVLAKPAEQTSLIAFRAVELLLQAGVPQEAISLLLARGSDVGEELCSQPDVAGIAFTGSTQTAATINRLLGAKEGPIAPLIAETGGINAMVTDSSALPEQLVDDVINSAFKSAGQRCSALRVLFVAEPLKEQFSTLLAGAMAKLTLGNPHNRAVDVGPVISAAAQKELHNHICHLRECYPVIADNASQLDESLNGYYIAPCAVEVPSMDSVEQEIFGPVLHVVFYEPKQLDDVIAQINRNAYGLTLGIHSRIEQFIHHVSSRVQVGNIYVNRSMVGAVVGSQPFGGCKLSGTGPKAGGPHYLLRFMTESTMSVNTTAFGGNTDLLS